MTAIAIGICVLWPSTILTIPANWARKTSLDGKYLRQAAAGADSDLVSSFGAATHNHSSPAHNHTQNSHVHTMSGGAGSGAVGATRNVTGLANGATHIHASANSASATATNQTTAMTVNSTSNDLLRYEPIVIESDGTPTGIPDGADAFFLTDSIPASWSRVQGNSYLKGAPTGEDADDVQTGSVTHDHTSDAHTHTQDAHTHANSESAIATGGIASINSEDVASVTTHNHEISFSSDTATNQNATATVDASNHEPPYRKINIIRNGTGGASLPDGVVVIWTGTHAGIPSVDGWARVTNYDGSFLKGASGDGESDVTTGGNTSHSHTSPNHTHVQNAHNHTGTSSGETDAAYLETGGGQYSIPPHTHTWTIGNTTATNQNTAATVSNNTSESAFPVYQKIILIKYTSGAPPAAAKFFVSRLALLGAG